MKYISDKGFEVKKVEGKKDAKYGIDIEVIGKGQHFYLQVKPLTFFMSNYPDTNEDRIDACRKREEIMKLEGLDTFYIIYDLDWETSQLRWLLNKKDVILFKITDLFEYDKNNIRDTFVRLKLPTEYMETLV